MNLANLVKVVSGLHKQNFDLKLELYHRRERQSQLEDRLEGLEAEKTQAEEMNETLVVEMEKRDKAIEEAVAMIITLEAKMEELAKERDMVRHVEAQGFYGMPPHDMDGLCQDVSPRSQGLDDAQHEDDGRALNRMPSFMSDRSEKTENLRNVYLGAMGSVLSLPRVAEGSSEIDHVPTNGYLSPTLSVLSESSFTSVYGQHSQNHTAPVQVDEPLSLDGSVGQATNRRRSKSSAQRQDMSQQTAKVNSFSRGDPTTQFQPIAGVVAGSPLQNIERMERSVPQRREASRPPSSSRNVSSSDLGKPTSSPSRRATKDEKREALRKVMTDVSGGVSLHEPVLPPTPDTVASSTLRRFKNSNDTLGRRHDGMEGRSQDSIPPYISNNSGKPSGPVAAAPPSVKPSVQVGLEQGWRRNDPQREQNLPPRPQSADDSTVSHRRGRRWSMDSDKSETNSFDSSLDIWLRAGGSRPEPNGRASPDLFGFPTGPARGSWAMNAMLGSKTVYNSGTTVNQADLMQDLYSAQEALFPGSGPPPTPNRRSSLNAQTKATGITPDETTPKAATKTKNTQPPPGRRPRHFRRNSDDAQMRAGMKTPVPGQLSQPPPPPPQQLSQGDQKRNHYPPIAGHQGARNGLTRLFRRSLGGSSSSNAPENPQRPSTVEPLRTESSQGFQPPTAPPSWIANNSALEEDDRTGATPPPILRNPTQNGATVLDVDTQTSSNPGVSSTEAMMLPFTSTAKAVPGSPLVQEHHENNPVQGAATGSRRKWLPAFGRSSSLKNKNG